MFFMLVVFVVMLCIIGKENCFQTTIIKANSDALSKTLDMETLIT